MRVAFFWHWCISHRRLIIIYNDDRIWMVLEFLYIQWNCKWFNSTISYYTYVRGIHSREFNWCLVIKWIWTARQKRTQAQNYTIFACMNVWRSYKRKERKEKENEFNGNFFKNLTSCWPLSSQILGLFSSYNK